MARANENASAQGSCDLNLTFMAFRRAEASLADRQTSDATLEAFLPLANNL